MRLTESEQTTLRYIAEGVSDKYAIAKNLAKSYSVVYYAIEKLLKLRLIETMRSRKGEKNPNLDVKSYGLTLPGLCEALSIHSVSANLEEIDSMVQRWGHFHFILNNWKFLNEKLPKNEVLACLQTAASHVGVMWINDLNHKMLDDDSKTLFARTFFINILTITPTTQRFFNAEKWIEAIKSNKEFREFIIRQLKEDIDKERKELAYREKLLLRL